MLRKVTLLFYVVTTFIIIGATCVLADPIYDIPYLGLFEKELQDGEYYVIKNEEGKILSKMARVVYEGDELIAEDNKHYRIYKVEGNVAYAEYVGKHDIVFREYIDAATLEIAENEGENQNNLIAVYTTHSDESYVPDDGTESKPGEGGIKDVAAAFSATLEKNGVKVIYSDNNHEPHDANAYKRSRRTAVELMKEAPMAIIDIHRDGIEDPDYYNKEISGESATSTRLVVGRQNQNMQSNLEFAKTIKSKINEIYPGLVKEIFIAKGNYNQDLSPRALLIEVGTHTNDKDRAINAATFFADGLPQVLGISDTGEGSSSDSNYSSNEMNNSSQNKTDWTSVLWILGITIIGGGGFLLLSTGSLKGAGEKLREFTSTEWANFMGGINKKYLKHNVQESDINNKNLSIDEKLRTTENFAEEEKNNKDGDS